MKFYSYEYVLSKISQQNWTLIIGSTLLVIVTVFLHLKLLKIKKKASSVNYRLFLF